MKLKYYIQIIILIGILSCSSSTEPEITENLLVTDIEYFTSDLDFVNVLPVLDIDFSYVYHYENSGGQLVNYRYMQRDLKTDVSISFGYSLSFDHPPRVVRLKFEEPNVQDTLRFSKVWDISNQDTIYQEFTFTLRGFFCDSSFSQFEDTLNLESFEHSYIDTFLIIQ